MYICTLKGRGVFEIAKEYLNCMDKDGILKSSVRNNGFIIWSNIVYWVREKE